MAIVKLEDVIAWEREDGWIYCDNCAPDNTDHLTPISKEHFQEDEYAIICDQCRKRVQ
jgi:Zn finger protein HypA/HybF involved in hydrogenase expression